MGNAIFLSFPYVCPEPVLGKLMICIWTWRKNGVYLPGRSCRFSRRMPCRNGVTSFHKTPKPINLPSQARDEIWSEPKKRKAFLHTEIYTIYVLNMYIYSIYMCIVIVRHTPHTYTEYILPFPFSLLLLFFFRPFFFPHFFFTFHLIKKSGKNQIKNKSTTTSKVVPYHVVIE